MMRNIVVAGRLTKDAESRQAGNSNVTAFSVAVDQGWGDKKSTIFFDCSWFGSRGEKVQSYLTKGSQVTVSGEFSTRENNGKTYLSINVSDLTLQSGGQRNSAPQAGHQAPLGHGGGGYDDEIPFGPCTLL